MAYILPDRKREAQDNRCGCWLDIRRFSLRTGFRNRNQGEPVPTPSEDPAGNDGYVLSLARNVRRECSHLID